MSHDWFLVWDKREFDSSNAISDSMKSTISPGSTIQIPLSNTIIVPKQVQEEREEDTDSPPTSLPATNQSINASEQSIRKTVPSPNHPPKSLPRPPNTKKQTTDRLRPNRPNQLPRPAPDSTGSDSIINKTQSSHNVGGLSKQPVLSNSIKLPNTFELVVIHCFSSSSSTEPFSYTIHSSIESERKRLVIHYVDVVLDDSSKE